MILEVPDIDCLIAEAKEAGAARIYSVYKTETVTKSGLVTYRTRFVATAAGLAACGAGQEKVLIRFERDFGPVLEDIGRRRIPDSYQERVEAFGEEARRQLAAAGFEIRSGEITTV